MLLWMKDQCRDSQATHCVYVANRRVWFEIQYHAPFQSVFLQDATTCTICSGSLGPTENSKREILFSSEYEKSNKHWNNPLFIVIIILKQNSRFPAPGSVKKAALCEDYDCNDQLGFFHMVKTHNLALAAPS